MTKPGPSVTSGADTQPGSDSLFPSGFGGGSVVRTGGVGTGEIADGSVAAADLNLASVGTVFARTRVALSAEAAGVDVTGATDSTAAVQAMVDAAISTGKTIVELPAGRIRIDGSINITATIDMRGAFGPAFPPASWPTVTAGTIIDARNGTADGSYVINITNTAGATKVQGVRLANIALVGGDGGSGGVPGARIDRGGIYLNNVQSELSLENVFVFAFQRSGIKALFAQDGWLTGVRLLYCGTEGTYAALDIDTSGSSNSNALHFSGCHFEQCPYLLHLAGNARHVQFMACKFELYAYLPATAPIQIVGSLENTFEGCQFVSRSVDDVYFTNGTDVTLAAHMILCDGAQQATSFIGCMFTTAPYYTGFSGQYKGSRWIKSVTGIVQVIGNTFEVCWGGAGPKSFMLGTDAVFIGNRLYSRSVSGERNMIEVATDCIVANNQIRSRDSGTSVTTGSIFTTTGSGNTFSKNKVRGTYNTLLAGTQTTFNGDNDVQIVTATGGGTWIKSTDCTTVTVVGLAGGAGGGSGRRGAAASVRCGGGGGGGGAVSRITLPGSILPNTVSYSVGAGGAGGAAITVNDTNGNSGANGGNTNFGTYLRCTTGLGGGGGTNAAGTAGTGGTGTSNGGAGGAASGTGGVGSTGAGSIAGAGGGGAGGGITSGDVAAIGGTGAGSSAADSTATAAGAVDGTLPSAGNSQTAGSGAPGSGGAGGSASITTTAQTGGAGGLYGAGGGGGGASLNGNNSGAGGAGANGILVIIASA